jgi:hypothetical protein
VVTTRERDADARSAAASGFDPDEAPMLAPVSRALTWDRIHRLSQTPAVTEAADTALISAIRDSATIRRGTRMVKIVELGSYEMWAPAVEVEVRETDVRYRLDDAPAAPSA